MSHFKKLLLEEIEKNQDSYRANQRIQKARKAIEENGEVIKSLAAAIVLNGGEQKSADELINIYNALLKAIDQASEFVG